MTKSRDRILELFRQSTASYVSGEEICRDLGISRTAVWKQIRQLRDLGYEIEAIPSKGYCLQSTPDTLISSAVTADLGTDVIGKDVVYIPQTDSTNLQARLLAEQGAEDGTVVIADQQSSGKGRMGRYWVSPAGVNLYLSVILRPDIQLRNATQMTFLTAVAVAEAIEASGDFSPQLKWPNDVLLAGKKIAGLLNELNAETEQIHFMILGIGVNLNMTEDQFPANLRSPATSLLVAGGMEIPRLDFTRNLLQRIDHLYALYLDQGFTPILSRWEKRCNMLGKKVEVDYQHSRLTGIVKGLDDAGALLLTLPNGAEERVLAGDVRLLP
jgi:BirA family biotin operon repressor/biotin-[acetyl-CoA-carboxylase] ligase